MNWKRETDRERVGGEREVYLSACTCLVCARAPVLALFTLYSRCSLSVCMTAGFSLLPSSRVRGSGYNCPDHVISVCLCVCTRWCECGFWIRTFYLCIWCTGLRERLGHSHQGAALFALSRAAGEQREVYFCQKGAAGVPVNHGSTPLRPATVNGLWFLQQHFVTLRRTL